MRKILKRIAAIGLIGVLVILTMAACGKEEDNNNEVDIVIGTANGSLCLAPLHIAIDNGYFEEEFEKAGITWRIEEIYI